MKLAREQRIRQKLYWFQEAREWGNVIPVSVIPTTPRLSTSG